MSSSPITTAINKLPAGKKFAHLIRREFVEHRGSYFYTPIVLGLVMVAMVLLGLITNNDEISTIQLDNDVYISDLASAFEMLEEEPFDVREKVMSAFLGLIAAPFFVALPFIMVFSVLGSLFDDRKDKSILFWKSMPFSDTSEVVSKLISAMILAPILALALAFVFQFVFMIIATLVVAFNGGSVWDIVWAPAPLFTQPLGTMFSWTIVALWQLPFWGWLILASSIAPRAPLLIAAVPLGVIAMLEEIFYHTSNFAEFMLDVIALNYAPIFEDAFYARDFDKYSRDMDVNVLTPGDAFFVMGESLTMGNFYGMLALGAAFIAGAIYIRKSNVRL